MIVVVRPSELVYSETWERFIGHNVMQTKWENDNTTEAQ